MQVIVQKFELGLYRPLELIYYRLGMYLSDTNIVLRLILWAAACVTRVAAVLLALPAADHADADDDDDDCMRVWLS